MYLKRYIPGMFLTEIERCIQNDSFTMREKRSTAFGALTLCVPALTAGWGSIIPIAAVESMKRRL